jgi:hypothetical protein
LKYGRAIQAQHARDLAVHASVEYIIEVGMAGVNRDAMFDGFDHRPLHIVFAVKPLQA